ncbi:hypothetical protein CRUP_025023 [Coryphaenoides rupestris]|nr:hypothetical protein CRUP_025023 [Coryphaenoides rupestris]
MSKDRDAPHVIDMTTSEMVVELLNQAALIGTEEKLTLLKQEMIAFQTDKSMEVRKFVIGFMEEACKRDNELLLRLGANLNMLLKDESVNVVKKAILTLTQLYKVTLQWMVRSKSVTEMQEACWNMLTEMKEDVLALLDSENDGVHTHAIKFTESLIISLSPRTSNSDVPKRQDADISLDKIPKDHSYIRYGEEGKAEANLPPTLAKSQVSSVRKNLKIHLVAVLKHPCSLDFQAQIGTLLQDLGMPQSEIARATPTPREPRKRPRHEQYTEGKKIKMANLPPTLAKSQVSSVRKNLKIHLVAVLKHPCSLDFQAQIGTLLQDLGMPQSEIARATPTPREPRKRPRHEQYTEGKKIKMGEGGACGDSVSTPSPAPPAHSAIDLTAHFLHPLLNPENVANLVLISMVYLPDVMPASFQATYTPKSRARQEEEEVSQELLIRRKMPIAQGQAISVVGSYGEKQPAIEVPVTKNLPEPILLATQPKLQSTTGRKKVFRLADVVQPLLESQIEKLTASTVRRILNSEKTIAQSGMSHFEGMMKEDVLAFILEDIRGRSDLAFSLLYQEYNAYLSHLPEGLLDGYDHCLYTLLSGLQEKPEQRDGLFTKLVLEAPIITESALEVIRRYCEDESRVYLGMTTLKELIVKRPSRQFQYLHVLLDLSSHDKEKVRSTALAFIKRMYEKDQLRDYIEKFALNYMQLLVHPNPPSLLFGADKDTEVAAPWTEETVRQCLFLYLSLLPLNHRLVHELASIHLVAVLKHPCSLDFQAQIGTLLQDLGMPQSEIARATPTPREPRKRPRHEQYTEGKKIKMEPALMEDDEEKEEPVATSVSTPSPAPPAHSAIDLTAHFLHPLLNPENVANLVLISMVYLPDVMPASFQATYTPAWRRVVHGRRRRRCPRELLIRRKMPIAQGQAISVVGSYGEKQPAIEVPIRGMGMNSPDLLLLVETCPKGAETLVTRCLHILTDKVPPSPELVERVRDLYHKRVPDVRFLIPVINGLEKKEVILALPKLIKLNPIVVKEVFNRLLGTQHSEGSSSMSPLTPGELLISLHNIDSIKSTNLCYGEKNVYTSEVLAVVMQQLIEQSPLPMLLMRTVIQSLSMYPRLGGFVMNILSRLIGKQVWKHPKVWEGFVKCCQRTKPQSFSQAHLPPSVMGVLEASEKPEAKPAAEAPAERRVEATPAPVTVVEATDPPHPPLVAKVKVVEDRPVQMHHPPPVQTQTDTPPVQTHAPPVQQKQPEPRTTSDPVEEPMDQGEVRHGQKKRRKGGAEKV